VCSFFLPLMIVTGVCFLPLSFEPQVKKEPNYSRVASEMRFGILRNIIQPLSRTLQPRTFVSSGTNPFRLTPLETNPQVLHGGSSLSKLLAPWNQAFSHIHSLTDTRYPKRRPVDKPRRKRASLRPPGLSTLLLSPPIQWCSFICSAIDWRLKKTGSAVDTFEANVVAIMWN